jgi:hypothetical protein
VVLHRHHTSCSTCGKTTTSLNTAACHLSAVSRYPRYAPQTRYTQRHAEQWTIRGSNTSRGKKGISSPNRPAGSSFPREGRGCESGWSVKLTTHPELEPTLRESGAVPLLLLHAFTSRTVTLYGSAMFNTSTYSRP